MEELKPCPFCGEKENLRVYTNTHAYGFPSTYSAGCKQCGTSTREYTEAEYAIDAWNRRVVLFKRYFPKRKPRKGRMK